MKHRLPLTIALHEIAGMPHSQGEHKDKLAMAASKILLELYISFSEGSNSEKRECVASLTVLGLMARLLDSHLFAELGGAKYTDVYKYWLVQQDSVLANLSDRDSMAVQNAVERLTFDFQSSLYSSRGAQSLAEHLSALSLSIFITYPTRELASSQFGLSKEALFGLIKAFEARA